MAAPAKDDLARTHRIVQDLGRVHPDARFELDFTNPLELLIALILAAQFRDDRVNQITPALFARYRTARDYASAPPDELETALREVNFFRQKTKAVQRCTTEIVARFGGEVPRALDDLLTLPYVGRKTANVLRANAFGDPAIGVDRHVARLSQRIGLTREEEPDRIEADLSEVVAPADQIRFCHLLQWHGRRVCLARTPLCAVCVIQPLCDYGRSEAGNAGATKGGAEKTTQRAKGATTGGARSSGVAATGKAKPVKGTVAAKANPAKGRVPARSATGVVKKKHAAKTDGTKASERARAATGLGVESKSAIKARQSGRKTSSPPR